VGGDAQDVHPTGGVFDHEEDVEPVQCDRVEVEQVAGEDAVSLHTQKLRPGRTGSPWGMREFLALTGRRRPIRGPVRRTDTAQGASRVLGSSNAAAVAVADAW
jgi:hypothetical protein